jgi:hypothetical protein
MPSITLHDFRATHGLSRRELDRLIARHLTAGDDYRVKGGQSTLTEAGVAKLLPLIRPQTAPPAPTTASPEPTPAKIAENLAPENRPARLLLTWPGFPEPSEAEKTQGGQVPAQGGPILSPIDPLKMKGVAITLTVVRVYPQHPNDRVAVAALPGTDPYLSENWITVRLLGNPRQRQAIKRGMNINATQDQEGLWSAPACS